MVDPISVAANGIAFVAVASKTIHDLLWNPRRFRADLRDLQPLEAARRKRERGDKATAIAFCLLAVSYGMFLWGAIR